MFPFSCFLPQKLRKQKASAPHSLTLPISPGMRHFVLLGFSFLQQYQYHKVAIGGLIINGSKKQKMRRWALAGELEWASDWEFRREAGSFLLKGTGWGGPSMGKSFLLSSFQKLERIQSTSWKGKKKWKEKMSFNQKRKLPPGLLLKKTLTAYSWFAFWSREPQSPKEAAYFSKANPLGRLGGSGGWASDSWFLGSGCDLKVLKSSPVSMLSGGGGSASFPLPTPTLPIQFSLSLK